MIFIENLNMVRKMATDTYWILPKYLLIICLTILDAIVNMIGEVFTAI